MLTAGSEVSMRATSALPWSSQAYSRRRFGHRLVEV